MVGMRSIDRIAVSNHGIGCRDDTCVVRLSGNRGGDIRVSGFAPHPYVPSVLRSPLAGGGGCIEAEGSAWLVGSSRPLDRICRLGNASRSLGNTGWETQSISLGYRRRGARQCPRFKIRSSPSSLVDFHLTTDPPLGKTRGNVRPGPAPFGPGAQPLGLLSPPIFQHLLPMNEEACASSIKPVPVPRPMPNQS